MAQWPEILTEESIPVLPADTFFNIYVVEMAMMWYHITMLPSGSSYVHGRIVLFDESGKLIWFTDSFIPVTRGHKEENTPNKK